MNLIQKLKQAAGKQPNKPQDWRTPIEIRDQEEPDLSISHTVNLLKAGLKKGVVQRKQFYALEDGVVKKIYCYKEL